MFDTKALFVWIGNFLFVYHSIFVRYPPENGLFCFTEYPRSINLCSIKDINEAEHVFPKIISQNHISAVI